MQSLPHCITASPASISQEPVRGWGRAVLPLPGGAKESVVVAFSQCGCTCINFLVLGSSLSGLISSHDRTLNTLCIRSIHHVGMPSPSSKRRSAQRPGRRQRRADDPQEQEQLRLPPPDAQPQAAITAPPGPEPSTLQLTQLERTPADMPIDHDCPCGEPGAAEEVHRESEHNHTATEAGEATPVAREIPSGSQEQPGYNIETQSGTSWEERSQHMDPEDAEVEALLVAALDDIAGEQTNDQIELQWLIESYLLRSQLNNPAEQWRSLTLSGVIMQTTPPDGSPREQGHPRRLPAQPLNAGLEGNYDISTPTSRGRGQTYDIFTPPGTDSESEKACVVTKPRRGRIASACPTQCSKLRSLDQESAVRNGPSLRAKTSCMSNDALIGSQVSSISVANWATPSRASSCLGPYSQSWSYHCSMTHSRVECYRIVWGSRYKKPRTRQSKTRRTKKRRYAALVFKQACPIRAVACHKPCLSRKFVWSHLRITTIHAYHRSLVRVEQELCKYNARLRVQRHNSLTVPHEKQKRHDNNHTHTTTSSCTGPKSGGGVPTNTRILSVLCLLGNARGTMVTSEVRVGAVANVVPEARRLVNQRVQNGGEVVGPAINRITCPYTWSAKRAFRRACARAAANGTTMYRGRIDNLSSLQILNSQDTPPPHRRPRAIHPTRANRSGGRLRCITWNMSGASSAAYQELTCWLDAHQSEWDVVLVQETHWKGDTSCYASGPWHIVSTGTSKGDTSSGVAVFVHGRLAAADSISYRVHAQGRVLQVRIHGPTNAIDVLCVYQYVWRSTCNTEQNIHNRQKIWAAGAGHCTGEE